MPAVKDSLQKTCRTCRTPDKHLTLQLGCLCCISVARLGNPPAIAITISINSPDILLWPRLKSQAPSTAVTSLTAITGCSTRFGLLCNTFLSKHTQNRIVSISGSEVRVWTFADFCYQLWLMQKQLIRSPGDEFHFCWVFCNSAVLPMMNTQRSNCVWVFYWRAVHKWKGGGME